MCDEEWLRAQEESEELINQRIVRRLVRGMLECGYSVRQILEAFHPDDHPIIWDCLHELMSSSVSSSAACAA